MTSQESIVTKTRNHILLACTGSVAAIKIPEIVKQLLNSSHGSQIEIRIIVTEHSCHFFELRDLPTCVQVYSDKDEWSVWSQIGDPVLHIDLGKWSDIMVIVPLDANTLAKIAQGLCDNLLTCTVRAWDTSKPLLFCPAMNTRMWEHPVTSQHIQILKTWGYMEIPCVSKTLACGDIGMGAMAEVPDIVKKIFNELGALET